MVCVVAVVTNFDIYLTSNIRLSLKLISNLHVFLNQTFNANSLDSGDSIPFFNLHRLFFSFYFFNQTTRNQRILSIFLSSSPSAGSRRTQWGLASSFSGREKVDSALGLNNGDTDKLRQRKQAACPCRGGREDQQVASGPAMQTCRVEQPLSRRERISGCGLAVAASESDREKGASEVTTGQWPLVGSRPVSTDWTWQKPQGNVGQEMKTQKENEKK